MPSTDAGANQQPLTTLRSQILALIAIEDTGNNPWLQVPPAFLWNQPVIHQTSSSRTLLDAESGALIHNTGASGTVTCALPPAVPELRYRAHVRTAQALRLDPYGSETISNPTVGSADGAGGYYIGSSTIGSTLELVCVIAGRWEIQSIRGTWALQS